MVTRTPVYVSESACRQVLHVAHVVEQVENVFKWQADGQVIYSDPRAMGMSYDPLPTKMFVKGVVLPELGIAGFRVVGFRVQPDGSGPGSSEATRVVVLIDLETGSPLAFVDEHYNFSLRTAASVAVAARSLAPSEPTVGLIGVGAVGQAVARVFPHVLDVRSLRVTSRRAASRQAFAQELGEELSVPLDVVDSVDEIIESCNVIVTATTAESPLIRQCHVDPGALICVLGSFEIEGSMYRSADKFVVDDWLQTASKPDIKPLLHDRILAPEDLYAEMVDIVSGAKPGRQSADETIVVRAEGMGSQDVALAYQAFRLASARGLVQQL